MQQDFKFTEDIEAFLEPLTYDEFWYAVRPYQLTLQDYDHCERQIALGLVKRDTVLSVLKFMALDELKALYDLQDRPVTPWLKVMK